MRKTIHTVEHQRLVNLLRQLREDAGLTQGELAKKLRVDQSFVSKYETTERRLDLIEVETIAKALGLSLSQVVSKYEASNKKRTAKGSGAPTPRRVARRRSV